MYFDLHCSFTKICPVPRHLDLYPDFHCSVTGNMYYHLHSDILTCILTSIAVSQYICLVPLLDFLNLHPDFHCSFMVDSSWFISWLVSWLPLQFHKNMSSFLTSWHVSWLPLRFHIDYIYAHLYSDILTWVYNYLDFNILTCILTSIAVSHQLHSDILTCILTSIAVSQKYTIILISISWLVSCLPLQFCKKYV